MLATACIGAYLTWRGTRSFWKAGFAFFALPIVGFFIAAVLLGPEATYAAGQARVFVLGILVIAAGVLLVWDQ